MDASKILISDVVLHTLHTALEAVPQNPGRGMAALTPIAKDKLDALDKEGFFDKHPEVEHIIQDGVDFDMLRIRKGAADGGNDKANQNDSGGSGGGSRCEEDNGLSAP